MGREKYAESELRNAVRKGEVRKREGSRLVPEFGADRKSVV